MGPQGMARRVAQAWIAAALALGCQSLDGTPTGAHAGAALEAPPAASVVTALGRLKPKDGILRLAGPSRPSVVIAELLVDEGDWVEAGQPIAVLDTRAENEARVARTRSELANANAELGRQVELFRQGIASVSLRDAAQLRVDVAKAEVQAAQSALELDTVRAPVRAEVIKIHARRGERVGADGIAEVGQIDRMYAVAEVYETDIGRVKVGQKATMRSRALDPALTGTVERIGMKIGRLDMLDTDPAARTDARVVEVDIQIDDSARAARLSNLQVEVSIQPD